jgi:hypothetical protein
MVASLVTGRDQSLSRFPMYISIPSFRRAIKLAPLTLQ